MPEISHFFLLVSSWTLPNIFSGHQYCRFQFSGEKRRSPNHQTLQPSNLLDLTFKLDFKLLYMIIQDFLVNSILMTNFSWECIFPFLGSHKILKVLWKKSVVPNAYCIILHISLSWVYFILFIISPYSYPKMLEGCFFLFWEGCQKSSFYCFHWATPLLFRKKIFHCNIISELGKMGENSKSLMYHPPTDKINFQISKTSSLYKGCDLTIA